MMTHDYYMYIHACTYRYTDYTQYNQTVVTSRSMIVEFGNLMVCSTSIISKC